MARCADCGFLTMRNLYTGALDEMDGDLRATGNPPQQKQTFVGGPGQKVGDRYTTPYRNVPICFARAHRLAEEVPLSEEVRKANPDLPPDMVLEVITKDRGCAAFTDWQQGFTPKEHRDLQDREELWEREERRDERVEEHHREQMQEVRRQVRWQLIVGGLLVAAAIVISTIVGAAITAEWISRPW